MRTWTLLALFGASCLSVAGCESEIFLTEHSGVEEGNEALEAGEAGEAITAYEAAAESIPESAGLNYDRGLALSELSRHDESTQMLLRALDTRDARLKGDVMAGLGLAYGRWGLHIERTGSVPSEEARPEGPGVQGEGPNAAEAALPKWERAVEHLEDALASKPADPDILRNLEVALLRVDPPCSARDDEAEPNDAPGAPHLLDMTSPAEVEAMSAPVAPGEEEAAQDELTWKRALVACPDNAEWYAVHLEAGDRLEATLEVEDGPAPLGLSLHTPGGVRQLRPPEGRDGLITHLELTASAQGSGDYLLQVSNPQADEVSYGLEVVVRPACERVEDHLEDNDTRFDAQDVTPGPIDGLKLCPGDPDWYAVTLAQGESLFVFASPQGDEEEEEEEEEETEGPASAPAAPALELSLYDGEGSPISDGAPADTSRVATLLNPGEGRYLIRVGGPQALETRYQLLVQVVPPCPDGDDTHEDNDLVEDATDLMALMTPDQGAGAQGGGEGPPTVLMRICPGDTDWLAVSSDPEAPTVVSFVFEHEKGDLAVRLTNSTGDEVLEEIDASSLEQNGESVGLPVEEEPTTYALEVRGKDDAENFYLLRMDRPKGGGDGEGEPPEDPEEDQEEQDDPPEDQKDQEDQEKPPEEKKEPEPQTPIEDRLDKLDHNPKNLEALQKALQSRRGPPEKDW